jgi:hypothetical protein
MHGSAEEILAVFLILLVAGSAGASMLIEDYKAGNLGNAEDEDDDQGLHGRDHKWFDDNAERGELE